jgi:hypothetical protein
MTVRVFKFADVLEQLESKFYSQALKKFKQSDFTNAGFSLAQLPIEQFKSISKDESTHSTVLQNEIVNLGHKPITSCSFDFSEVLTDVSTMAAAARLVENTGVGAYLGAAHLLSDPVLLTAAASILTVEARHQTVLNILNSGTAIPQAFDIPLAPQEVLAIAGGFISNCDVGVKANPSLAVTNKDKIRAGTYLTFSSSAIKGSTDGLYCQMLVGGRSFSITLPLNQCKVPNGITGPVALWVTNDNQPLINNPIDRVQDEIVAGPTMIFLDNQPQVLEQLVRSTSGSSSTATTTINPSQASSIMSSAKPSATGVPGSGSRKPSNNNSGGPNKFKGLSPDGRVIVNGWSTNSTIT